ncbi:head GIN domain-containing protein [Pararcticibacter amylolyticus]|uniref:Putative auto-transporter adhesin head GIN domain-containing protein n=1 Tax=Pararcticibacter amylolyticus TaxID=2173175 RepID=A0A2U2PET4_9SPHI|nr:head GIN domain-containing protein [Pararcticibacter amylolyticus]PWG79896.1 hypothetical protein DDR33_13920 [Pararcticibacter amylolyticus]
MMKIKSLAWYFTLLLPALLSGCNLNCVNPSGKTAAVTKDLERFSKISVGGALKVFIKQSDKSSVSIEADENVLPLIKARVSGETLEVRQETNLCNAGEVKVYITSPEFKALDLSGAVEVANGSPVNGEKLDLSLSGASKADIRVNVEELRTEASGACEINLQGRANRHHVEMSGAGSLKAPGLQVADYHIEGSGACKLSIHATESLDVNSSGAVVVEYKGNPQRINNNSSGASHLKKLGE